MLWTALQELKYCNNSEGVFRPVVRCLITQTLHFISGPVQAHAEFLRISQEEQT